MRRLAIAFLAAAILVATLLGCRGSVETDLTWREKRAERRLRARVLDEDRFVDVGVILRVVVADPNGADLIPAKPKLRVVREHGPFGGMLDTRQSPPRIVAESRDPVIWYCSEDQEVVILHDDPEIPGQLIWGSEGAGKTRVLAMLHYFWWMELVGRKAEVGQTAPTRKRLAHVLTAMRALYPPRWWKYLKHEQRAVFADGHAVQFVSAKKVSEAQGSPGQGYGWKKIGRDELQDQVDQDADFESRSRDADIDPRNDKMVCNQAATCTAKQSPAFRDLTALKLGSGKWIKRTLLIARSPFIHPSFLEEKRLVMTEREWRRRYLCEDLPPEKMVYFNWDRARNLRPIPPTAKRITSYVLRQKRVNAALLAGNDPGLSKAATVFLDAYECGCQKACVCGLRQLGGDWAWWVRGEVFTMHKTNELHAAEVLADVRRRGYNVRPNAERVHIRSHPYGQSDSKPTKNVYRIFRRVGLDVAAAQHKKDGTGTGLIALEDRIEMLNTLLFDASERTRLYVEADAKGQPVAPRLVEGFETMERDEEGNAETEKKNDQDKSDPPAACGYGLWNWEREATQLARILARRKAAA